MKRLIGERPRTLSQSQPKAVPPEVLPCEIFQKILDRERARADRSGSVFSLILLSPQTEKAEVLLHCAASFLTNRVRDIDIVGYYDRHRLGVILPETGPEGALRLLNEVQHATEKARKAEGLSASLHFTVHSYPQHSTGLSTHDGSKAEPAGPDSDGTGMLSVFTVSTIPRWKRLADIAGAFCGLIVALPFFLLVPLLIKLVSRGPVFYRQERIGYRGKPFTMLKFRTMRAGCDTAVHRAHLQELMRSGKPMAKLDSARDRRLIPLGGFLRWSSLDELPQLFNVLRGDMSLIGPRPCLPYEAATFEPWHHRRFDTLPGMTGLWQVSGKNKTTFETMMRLDARYARRPSLLRDCGILLRTPLVVLGQFLERFFPARRCVNA